MRTIFRWLPRIVLIVVVLYFLLGIGAYLLEAKTPSVKDAPWVIQTYSNDAMRVPSRFYLASKVQFDGSTPIITNYWSFDGKRYHRHKGSKEFPVDIYGQIGIVRRVEK